MDFKIEPNYLIERSNGFEYMVWIGDRSYYCIVAEPLGSTYFAIPVCNVCSILFGPDWFSDYNANLTNITNAAVKVGISREVADLLAQSFFEAATIIKNGGRSHFIP